MNNRSLLENLNRLIYVKTECFGNYDEKCGCARQTNWSLFIVSAAIAICYFFMKVLNF
jgi:hypothetical protein